MSKNTHKSAHSRIVDDYFKTTSAVSSAPSHESFVSSVTGLRRRLGKWFDVKGKDIVDLGSGTGELCYLAVDAGARSVVGVNLSMTEIEFARTHVDAVFQNQNINTFLDECADDSIDCIFAMNILEHLDKDTLVSVLDGAFRCLRAGGELIAMVPNATSPFGGMTRYWDITHQLSFTPSSVRQLVRLTGFNEVSFRECGPIPHGFISAIRFTLWRGICLLIRSYLLIELASSKGGIYTADMMFRLRKTLAVK